MAKRLASSRRLTAADVTTVCEQQRPFTFDVDLSRKLHPAGVDPVCVPGDRVAVSRDVVVAKAFSRDGKPVDAIEPHVECIGPE
jgi:acyl-homoserine lactone acylase PvdQ